MSVDKLVDSTQLDTDLTSVADAIRTKGGTSASLAFPAGFVSAVEAIPTGSPSVVKISSYLTSVEMNSYSVLAAMDAKLFYKNSVVLMMIINSEAATGGNNYSNNNYYMSHDNQSINSRENQAWLQQKPGKLAPSTMAGQFCTNSSTWYGSNVSVINADGSFQFRASDGSIMIPANSLCLVIEIPNQYYNGSVDLRTFGS